MSRKENLHLPVNIYWDHAPSKSDDALKDILPPGSYHKPGRIINSSHVQAEAKPWLKQPVKKMSKKVDSSIPTKIVSYKQSPVEMCAETIVNKTIICNATLRDLRKEDKQKVANLIKELAKFGEEKENAVNMLNTTTVQYQTKLKMLQDEKRKAITEQDILKEKLLEYEIHIKEQKRSNEFPTDSAVDSLYLQGLPGNIKSTNQSYGDGNVNSLENNKFTDVFLEQQTKFKQQQDILQQQINQLQKLQESLVIQQQRSSLPDVHGGSGIRNMFAEQLTLTKTNDPNETVGENTMKLQSYILQESNDSIQLQQLQNNSETQKIKTSDLLNKTVDTLAPDTTLSRSSVLKELPTSPLKKFNASPEVILKPKYDICLQTDGVSSDKSMESDRLEQCEKSINRLEQSLNYVASLSSKLQDSSKSQVNTIQKQEPSLNATKRCYKKHESQTDDVPEAQNTQRSARTTAGITQKTKTPFKQKTKTPLKQKQSNSKELMQCLLDMSSSSSASEDEDEARVPHLQSSIRNTGLINSAVKRRHFQPSSMIDLVEGLQPRSASTSVDQYSLHKASKTSTISQTFDAGKHSNDKKAFERQRLQNIYGKQKQKPMVDETCSDEETEERNVLDDVFFVK